MEGHSLRGKLFLIVILDNYIIASAKSNQMAKTIRVYKSDNVWVAKRDGASKASIVKSTQRDAYLAAREIALNQGLTITVYHPNGGIRAVINPKNREEESNCFITTSCVKYFGLNDNCYELQTLRKFRDTYLLKSIEGKNLVKEYYLLAPTVVEKLEAHRQRKILFTKVFKQIQKACRAIESKNYEDATGIYKRAITYLFNYFKLK